VNTQPPLNGCESCRPRDRENGLVDLPYPESA
jgi:hypothetical protein